MLNAILQTLLPHHLLSRLMLRFLRIRLRWLKNLQIKWVIRQFDVDMTPSQTTDWADFEHFNAFFTRAMKPEARPIAAHTDNNSYCSPVDGVVSQFGGIHQGRLLQAKGMDYSLLTLVGGKRDVADDFVGGHFATIYLAPKNYHRVHMPAAGKLQSMIYVPGRLFSVADSLVNHLPGLFNRNERIVCLFETAHGSLAVIMVGAIFVGCLETVWHGVVSPPQRRAIERTDYTADDAIALSKGDELGRFNMGSTVIVLWAARDMAWMETFACGEAVRMGQQIAFITRAGG